MTDYERGFNDGFAAALERSETYPRGGEGFKEGRRNKLAVSFSDDEFARVTALARERRLGAAVRSFISECGPGLGTGATSDFSVSRHRKVGQGCSQ